MTARVLGALLLAMFTLLGCGTYQTRPVLMKSYPGASPGTGVVCVVRAADDADDADDADSTVPVWDNGVLVGATRGASHFCYRAEAGPHRVVSELLVTAELRMDVRAEEHHWIATEVGVSSYLYSSGVPRRLEEWVSLREMSAAEAKGSLMRTRRLQLVEAPSGETVPVGATVPARRLVD